MLRKADTYITVIDWFDQECNIAKGTKAVILVFVCDKEIKEPEKVLPEVLKF